MKILVQARPDLYMNPGGDGVLLLETSNALSKLGLDITIDLESRYNPANFDLVHIYNFATADAIRPFAEKAVAQNTPYVVTSLYENRIKFYQQMHVYSQGISHYIKNGQLGNWKSYEDFIKTKLTEDPTDILTKNQFLAKNASTIITSGKAETELIKRDFPDVKQITSCPFASSSLPHISSDLFESTYNVKDYIISVGRVEVRKNHGLLLKALEDDERTLVIVSGKISYNPDYEEVLKKFKRKGKTLFVKNLSAAMLSSAYAGARVHALPSWYELPGLVSLEAASKGANIVASRNMGTIEDYLGDNIFYCNPAEVDTIYEAINKAWDTPKSPELMKLASSYTWEKTALKVKKIYEDTLNYNYSEIEAVQ